MEPRFLSERPGGELADEELAREAKVGSREAFDALVLRYQRPVYWLARRMIGRHEEADDIAQETFLQTWNSLARYDTERPFRPWLLRIATNMALKTLRRTRSRREVELETIDSLPAPFPSRDSDPPGELRREATREALRRAMTRLSPPERMVLHLRIEEEMSYRQMAETMGVKQGTVMSRLHRARKSLRAHLAKEGLELGGEEPDATT